MIQKDIVSSLRDNLSRTKILICTGHFLVEIPGNVLS